MSALGLVHWQPIRQRRARAARMADRSREEREPRDPWDGGPQWIRIALQVLIVLVALSVWTYSTVDTIRQHKEPNLTTFGLLGLAVLLVYGQQIRRWWRQ